MKTFICLFAGPLLITALPNAVLAQASYGAEAYAARQQEEERWRKLSAQMDEMEKTQELLRNRINTLEEENRSLRNDVSKAGSAGVSPEEFQRVIKQVTDELKRVDEKRVEDNKTLVEQVKQLIRDLKPNAAVTSDNRAPTKPADPVPDTGEYYKHVIQPNESIWAVVQAFKAQGVNTSIKAVLDANPQINPKKLQVGQEIRIPKPQ